MNPLALAILATLAGILAAGLFVLVLAWHARLLARGGGVAWLQDESLAGEARATPRRSPRRERCTHATAQACQPGAVTVHLDNATPRGWPCTEQPRGVDSKEYRMKTVDECIAEAQYALSKAFRVTETNAEAAHHYTQIAHAWLQVARDLALRTEVPA